MATGFSGPEDPKYDERSPAPVDMVWSNYSDLTRPHPKWWLNKGNPLISGKPRFVIYYNLARYGKYPLTYKVLYIPGRIPGINCSLSK